MKTVYGIGNPLIDVFVNVTDAELTGLGLHKGTMNLINLERRQELVEFINKKKPSYSCGGSCPNTIITLASMGVPATLAGKVGQDDLGHIYKDKLSEIDVKDNLTFSENGATGSSIILITPDSERTMNTYLGANRDFCASDVVDKEVEEADFFHFTGYMWDTENQKESIIKALEIAKKNNTIISFDIADQFAVGRYHDDFLKLIPENCDIVFANKDEARMLFDNYDPRNCCKTLGKLCKTAVVKNGKKGSYVCHEGTLYEIPVQGSVAPIDTTGAGDNYAAGFLYGLCHGMNVEDSATIASILAGQIITQIGSQFSKEKASSLRTMLESNSWKK